jgi:hypothetical protein
MRHRTSSPSLAVLALAVAVLVAPSAAQAQGLPKDAIPFKAEVSGGFTGLPAVATEPPIMAFHMLLRGRSELMGGDVTFADIHYWQMGLDGNPVTATSLGSVLTGPTGDALFMVWEAVVPRPDGVVGGYGRFVVRGGRGKFVGAGGSGTMISALKGTNEVTQIYEGNILLPKK